ncbi:MAG: hypothetical protein ACRDVL_13235 [Acidimicrobiia bacterium]
MRHDLADVLPAIRVLLAELESQQIQYVVLGRQSRIESTLSGLGDLDILVSREDGGRAEVVLLRLGFREQSPCPGDGAVGNYVKWDTGSGTPVQVQLHRELRLGFAVAPSFRVPTAGELIDGSTLKGLVRVPSASDHLALHVVKGLLAWEATDLLAGRRRHPFDSAEVRLLLPHVSEEEFIGSVARVFPPLPWLLAGRIFIEAQRLHRDESGVAARLRLTMMSMSVRDSLVAWSDRPLLLAWLRSVRRRLTRLLSRRSHHPRTGRHEASSVDGSEPMPAQ